METRKHRPNVRNDKYSHTYALRTQTFTVQCNSCADDIASVTGTVASGCTIIQSGECVQALHESKLLVLKACDDGNTQQMYNFVTY